MELLVLRFWKAGSLDDRVLLFATVNIRNALLYLESVPRAQTNTNSLRQGDSDDEKHYYMCVGT
jgi:hypothetical protein